LVAGIFPGHNAVAKPASDARAPEPGDAAPRKNSSPTPPPAYKREQKPKRPCSPACTCPCSKKVIAPKEAFFATFRSTSFAENEKGADGDTKRCRFKTGSPPAYCEKGQVGLAAVDPKVIPYGSRIVGPHGIKAIAGDTGKGVVLRSAARSLAKIRHITDDRANAPVIDFFVSSEGKQIGGEWDVFLIIPYDGTVPFKDLPLEEKRRYFDLAAWDEAVAKNAKRLEDQGLKVVMNMR